MFLSFSTLKESLLKMSRKLGLNSMIGFGVSALIGIYKTLKRPMRD